MADDLVVWATSVWAQSARDRLMIEGRDAERYLQSQLAQDVAGMAMGERRWSLLLEPTGRISALIGVSRTSDERFDIDTDAGFAARVATRLRRFLLRVDVVIESLQSAGEASSELETERVARGWPKMGTEIVPDETLPAELSMLHDLVSFSKGCYPGQELVERMDSRGASSPYRIVGALSDLSVGSTIDIDGHLGVVTSSAGGSVLARIRRTTSPTA